MQAQREMVMQAVQYPLKLTFKLMALAPQIYIRDAGGHDLLYVHMKLFKLKEDIGVFSDSTKSRELYRIKADRIIDWSARYNFTDANGTLVGSVKREGMRSLWKASYNIFDESGNQVGHIKEDNAWIKVADALLSEIPGLGLVTGYFFNPSYTLYGMGETPMLNMKKEPSFFGREFSITKLAEPDPLEETRMLLSLLMMVLLERQRG